jgi:hypothetical protein
MYKQVHRGTAARHVGERAQREHVIITTTTSSYQFAFVLL